jgi:hypothetical protein
VSCRRERTNSVSPKKITDLTDRPRGGGGPTGAAIVILSRYRASHAAHTERQNPALCVARLSDR